MRPIMAKAIGYLKPDIDPNTRLYVPFNEGVGNVAKDYSQYGNHAQLTDVEWSPDGFNGAGKFNGSSSFGNCGNDASLNITDAITIEAWVKRDVTIGAARIVDKKYDGAYTFYLYAADAILGAAISLSDGNVDWFNSGVSIPLNIWTYVALTYDSSDHTIRLYKNGVEEATKSDVSGTINTNSDDFLIGNRATLDRPFNGTIDEVMIYALALSAAQNAADCYEVVCS